MRQIIYWSTSTAPGVTADLGGILEQSQHNNAADDITGLLWSDRRYFLQVFEGEEPLISATWARIQADDRHQQLVVLLDREIERAEFGDWAMAYRGCGEPADHYAERMQELLASASPTVREPFMRALGRTIWH